MPRLLSARLPTELSEDLEEDAWKAARWARPACCKRGGPEVATRGMDVLAEFATDWNPSIWGSVGESWSQLFAEPASKAASGASLGGCQLAAQVMALLAGLAGLSRGRMRLAPLSWPQVGYRRSPLASPTP